MLLYLLPIRMDSLHDSASWFPYGVEYRRRDAIVTLGSNSVRTIHDCLNEGYMKDKGFRFRVLYII